MSDRIKHKQHKSVVLFYRYFLPPLNLPTIAEIEELHLFLQEACNSSSIKGRILLATEGINGTLSAIDENRLKSFCQKVEGSQSLLKGLDWKFSNNKSQIEPFPDLKIAVVKEIVSTGSSITIDDIPNFGGKHLTPSEFHEALEDTEDKETVVIDVRNTFEYNIGHFFPPIKKGKETVVMNPEMVTFSSFNGFCDKNVGHLKDKKVLMYCTGGIRCEKASAMLKKKGVQDVNQLSGGIHRYLEEFGEQGFFQGKNFVFDHRVAIEASENKHIIGRCINCVDPYDALSGSRICTVCRDLVLVCNACQNVLSEYHCQLHSSWKVSYFTFLDRFDCAELRDQVSGLKELLVQSSSRNTKRTLRRQIAKVLERMAILESGTTEVDKKAPHRCRTCREPETICDGLCWGFWKTQGETEQEAGNGLQRIEVGQHVKPGPDWNQIRLGDPSQYDRGTVVQVKSWAGCELDCVVVLWDAKCGLDDSKGTIKRGHLSTQIYRFGVLAKDSLRKYDVVEIQ